MNRGVIRWQLALFVGVVLSIFIENAQADALSPRVPQENEIANPYSPRQGNPYRHGVVPTLETQRVMDDWEESQAQTTPAPAATGAPLLRAASVVSQRTLSFNGGINGTGVTSGSPRVYLVFWGTQWGTQSADSNLNLIFSGDPKNAAPYLQNFFKGLGTNGELWSGVFTQYCDGALPVGTKTCPAGSNFVGYPAVERLGGVLAGVWYDNTAAAPTNANGNQIAQEAIKAANQFGNTTAASNRYAQYVILSPPGMHPDGFNTTGGNFCAWHDWNGDTSLTGGAATSIYGDIAFTNMPYLTDMGTSCGQNYAGGLLDGFSMVAGHEYAETVTDQNPGGGWWNTTAGSPYLGQENGDECAWIAPGQPGGASQISLATGSFAVQSSWSNSTDSCEISQPVFSKLTAGLAQSISFTSVPTNLLQGATSLVKATSSSLGLVTFTSLSSTMCKVSDNLNNTATVLGVTAGNCTIAANQSGDGNFAAAPQATLTFPIGAAKQNQTIAFGTPPSLGVGGTGKVTATASSALAVTLSSLSLNICTVSGSTVTGKASGICTIAANQAGNTMFNAAPQVTQDIPVKMAQTIAFGTAPILSVGGSGSVSATASSGLTVTLTTTTSSICSLSGATVTGLAAGTCTVAANQSGDANYAPAPQATQNISVAGPKVNQTISFGVAPSFNVGGTGTLSATASSGLTVTFTSQTTGICSVAGTKVSGVAVGTCTIAANQAGNIGYNTAPQVTQSMTVGKGAQTITLSVPTSITHAKTGTVTAKASSNLPVTLTSTTSSICTISGSTVTGITAGTCTIAANQLGNTNYNPAPQVTKNITIN